MPAFVQAGLFGLAYALLARVSDELFRFPGSQIATFWPPGGFTLAIMLRARERLWPALFLGLLVFAVGEVLTLGMPPRVALGWGLGVALEPLLGALLLRRYLHVPSRLPRIRDILLLVGLGALLSPMASGLVGATTSALFLGNSFLTAWLNWWTSAALGVVLVGPFFLTTLAPHPGARGFPLTPARIGEALLLLVLTGALAQWLFHAPVPVPFALPLPAYASVPFILWGALRFGLPGMSAVAFTLAAIASWHTARGHGPFPPWAATPHAQVVSVQAFLAVTSLGGLLLAAALNERWRAERGMCLLADASALLTRSHDEKAALAEVARRLVPEFADGCALFLARGDGAREPVAVAHLQPALEPRLARHLELSIPGHEGSTWSTLLPEVRPGHLAALAHDEAHLRGLRALSPVSLLALPLRGDHPSLGSLVLLSSSPARRFDTQDRLLAEDLARRCALAVEQARLRRELQEAVRLRDDFLAIAAHELKTPLTPLSLQLDAMKRRLAHGQPVDPAVLDKLRYSLQRLVALINDLLDASRLAAGRLALHPAPLPLRQLIEDVSASFAATSPQHSVEAELPEKEVWVKGDRLRLEQVLANLLDNAIKYSPLGGPIRVSLQVHGEEAWLSVSDPGIGIPSDEQEHLFERFFRARNSPSRLYGGLGLGLFICRDIVEHHGGRIWVRSTVGEGSTFYIALPLLDAAHRAPRPLQLH